MGQATDLHLVAGRHRSCCALTWYNDTDMAKTLKLFNGRAYFALKRDDPRFAELSRSTPVQAYVAAFSRADARRVIEEYNGFDPGDYELRTFWSEGWGAMMHGIVPERGLWLIVRSQEPIRVV